MSASKLAIPFYPGSGDNRLPGNPFEEIFDASPRACAIVTAAVCEKRIEQTLRAHFRKDDGLLKALFLPGGPIGNFGPKTQLAFAMGLISETAFHDLKIITKVRNLYAHNFDLGGFNDQPVADHCRNLKLPEEHYAELNEENFMKGRGRVLQSNLAEGLADPRSRFVATNMIIANGLMQKVESSKGEIPYV